MHDGILALHLEFFQDIVAKEVGDRGHQRYPPKRAVASHNVKRVQPRKGYLLDSPDASKIWILKDLVEYF